jgi:hypothetical protein
LPDDNKGGFVEVNQVQADGISWNPVGTHIAIGDRSNITTILELSSLGLSLGHESQSDVIIKTW